MKTQIALAAAIATAAGLGWAPRIHAMPDSDRPLSQYAAYGLVEAARNATRKYANVIAALHDGYQPFLGCVSGSDMGAMGIHYVNGTLVGDGVLDPQHPEVLVYEPQAGGALHLVAVEYLVMAQQWNAGHGGIPPVLVGQSLDFTDTPNQYGLPAFYSIHVWAWKHNPLGPFSMWNPRVSCGSYAGS